MLCPEKHENPEMLSRCRICGLPLVDLQKELSLVSARLCEKAMLARPKPTNLLFAVGSFGANLMQRAGPAQRPAAGQSYVFVDTAESPKQQGQTAGIFQVRLGGSVAGSSTFCGMAEEEALNDVSLAPALKNAGLRGPDDRQTVLALAALGGGTGSGVTPVLLLKAHELNPVCHSVVLALLPSVEEAFHIQLNAHYGVARLLGAGGGPPAEAVISVQYDRLKRVRGVGRGGQELKMDSLMATMLGLLSSTLSFPNSARLARLNKAASTTVLVPCLALGHSMEIFGTLENVLESAIAFPLAGVPKETVASCYLLLRAPRSLADTFTESAVAEVLSGLIRKRLPMARSSIAMTTFVDDVSDRVDACLLLGGDAAHALHLTSENHEQFKAQAAKVRDWSAYGLTEDKAREMESTMADYDARFHR